MLLLLLLLLLLVLLGFLLLLALPRLDRKIEIPLPNEQARMEVLKIHANPITKHGEIDYEAVVKLSDGWVARLQSFQ